MLILLAAAASCAHPPGATPLDQANAALQAGEADKALALLIPLAQPGGTAEAYNLKCRVEYSIEHWDQAAEDCEQAVKLDGQNSEDHLWLARALGAKASRASFLSAFKLAKRVRAEFEEAVRLNPRNAEALADLGEYYYSAPAVVGGGIDKAEGVAAQLEKIDPVRAHEIAGPHRRAQEGLRRRPSGSTSWRSRARRIRPSSGSRWPASIGDASAGRRWKPAVRSGESAAERDKRAGVALYDGAELLIQTNRDPARAAKMLEEYLAGSAKREEAPAFVAHTWLARLKEHSGDKAAASRERAAALALAHEYKPALDLN